MATGWALPWGVVNKKLKWQSKTVLLAVLPFAAASIVLELSWWATNWPGVAIWIGGLCLLLGIVVLQLRGADGGGAFAGAVITATLMCSTVSFPYRPWHTALVPVLTVFVLSFAATRFGQRRKERLGVAEQKHGRSASQVAANLGAAALVSHPVVQSWLNERNLFPVAGAASALVFAPMLASLAEAAADTVSSEMGQVLDPNPRMITNLRRVEPGTDGGVSLSGSASGAIAAATVALAGTAALRGNVELFGLSLGGGVFGLLLDSLLGATLERRGWLNNDAVNFVSTAGAAAFAIAAAMCLRALGH